MDDKTLDDQIAKKAHKILYKTSIKGIYKDIKQLKMLIIY